MLIQELTRTSHSVSHIPLLPRKLKMKQVIFVPHKVVTKNTDFWCKSGVLKYFTENSKYLSLDVGLLTDTAVRLCYISIVLYSSDPSSHG